MVSVFHKTSILLVFNTRSCITLLALMLSFLISMLTLLHILDKYKASSHAVSPAPTIATSFPLKKNPSHTAHAETPWPLRRCSDSKPNHFAEAPVAMMITSDSIVCSSSMVATYGLLEKSMLVTMPHLISAPIRFAWASKSIIICGPMIPSGYPG